jgi:hypothetical protein
VRASEEDARFFLSWIDNTLNNIKLGGKWNKYFSNDIETIKERFIKARTVYQKIMEECVEK